MSDTVPTWFVLELVFVLAAAMTFGGGLLLIWQRVSLGHELKRQAEQFKAQLNAEALECRGQIDLLKRDLAERGRDEQALRELVKQHEQRWAYLALKGILPIATDSSINFTVGGDANIGGDVLGRDKNIATRPSNG